ncbi:MAG: YceI family protein [Acidobacteria bacterium]|nr:YceI family protein [Acidobacteriota bacterium]
MKSTHTLCVVTKSIGWTLAFTLLGADPNTRTQPVESQSASVKFMASTNLSAISIHGQSNALKIHGELGHEAGKLVVESIEARLDPKSLSTGMAIRDHHMREKIFANGSELPALSFKSPRTLCQEPAKGQEASCQVSGTFSMRGIEKPFSLSVRLKSEGSRYRVSGEGALKISDYGIEPPCQLGVCVTDLVKLRIEMQAEERVTSSKSEPALSVR